MRVPVKIVVNRMIDAPAVLSAKTDVERSDAIVLEKRGVVRPGAQRGNAQVRAFTDFLALVCGFSASDFVEAVAFPNGKLRLVIGNIVRDIISEFLQRV